MNSVGRGIDSSGIGDGKSGEVIQVWGDLFPKDQVAVCVGV